MILKKGLLTDFEILEICGQVNIKIYEQDPRARIEKPNTNKQEPPYQNETQNTKNRNTSHPRTTKQMLTQDDKINVESIKKIMTEKKTTLPSLMNYYWKLKR